MAGVEQAPLRRATDAMTSTWKKDEKNTIQKLPIQVDKQKDMGL